MNDLNDPQFRAERIRILQKEIRTYQNYIRISSEVGNKLAVAIQQLSVAYGSKEKRFVEIERNLRTQIKELESIHLEYQQRIKEAEHHIISLKAYEPFSNMRKLVDEQIAMEEGKTMFLQPTSSVREEILKNGKMIEKFRQDINRLKSQVPSPERNIEIEDLANAIRFMQDRNRILAQ